MPRLLLFFLLAASGCIAVPIDDALRLQPAPRPRCAPDVVRVELAPSVPLGPLIDAVASSEDPALEVATVRGRWRNRDSMGNDAWPLVLDARNDADAVAAAVRALEVPSVRYVGADRVPCTPVALGVAYGVPFTFEGVVSLVDLEWVIETAQSQYVPDSFPRDLREPGLRLEGVAEFVSGYSSLESSPRVQLLEVARLEQGVSHDVRPGVVQLALRSGVRLRDLAARYADAPDIEFVLSGEWDSSGVVARVRIGEEAAWTVRFARDDSDLLRSVLVVPTGSMTRN